MRFCTQYCPILRMATGRFSEATASIYAYNLLELRITGGIGPEQPFLELPDPNHLFKQSSQA